MSLSPAVQQFLGEFEVQVSSQLLKHANSDHEAFSSWVRGTFEQLPSSKLRSSLLKHIQPICSHLHQRWSLREACAGHFLFPSDSDVSSVEFSTKSECVKHWCSGQQSSNKKQKTSTSDVSLVDMWLVHNRYDVNDGLFDAKHSRPQKLVDSLSQLNAQVKETMESDTQKESLWRDMRSVVDSVTLSWRSLRGDESQSKHTTMAERTFYTEIAALLVKELLLSPPAAVSSFGIRTRAILHHDECATPILIFLQQLLQCQEAMLVKGVITLVHSLLTSATDGVWTRCRSDNGEDFLLSGVVLRLLSRHTAPKFKKSKLNRYCTLAEQVWPTGAMPQELAIWCTQHRVKSLSTIYQSTNVSLERAVNSTLEEYAKRENANPSVHTHFSDSDRIMDVDEGASVPSVESADIESMFFEDKGEDGPRRGVLQHLDIDGDAVQSESDDSSSDAL